MDIKLKSKDLKIFSSNAIMIFANGTLLFFVGNADYVFRYSFIVIIILLIQLIIKQGRNNSAIEDLDNLINKIDNRSFDLNKLKEEVESQSKYFSLGKKYNDGIIEIIDGVKDTKVKMQSNKKDVDLLIDNVINNLEQPIEDLKNKIEDLTIENVEEKVWDLKKREEVVEKLIIDVFQTTQSMSSMLPINKQEINLNYLLKQICGEFSLKMQDSNLNYEIEIEEFQFNYKIDVEKFCDVLEIVLQNAEKHSLEKSRVYIKSKTENRSYNIEIKNISKEKLNIKAEELNKLVLIQKKSDFAVTGLSLERCKNLIKAMGGILKIDIDGDLFKINIVFERGGE